MAVNLTYRETKAATHFVICVIIAISCAFFFPGVSCAENRAATVSVSAQATYAPYTSSILRKDLFAQTLAVAYSPREDHGYAASIRSASLALNNTWGTIDELSAGVSGHKVFRYGSAGYFGGAAALTFVSSDDANSDNMAVPYATVMFQTPLAGWYFDAGYSQAAYQDTTARQTTATFGAALFDYWVWSRTRIYSIALSEAVQGEDSVISAEEKITWYAVPGRLALSLYLLVGQRIHAYDPDLGIVYTLPDLQTFGAGASAWYDVTQRLRLYADLTYEAYDVTLRLYEPSTASFVNTPDSYSVVYGTLGARMTF
jgi:hypothetical protein